MTLTEFQASLKTDSPPQGVSPSLQALWHAGRGEWEHVHEIVQGVISSEGAWVHAYLHRQEGDSSNADYWYQRSRHPRSDQTLEQEWEAIVRALLGPSSEQT